MANAPKARKIATSMLLSGETKADIARLAKWFRVSHAALMEMAVATLARKVAAEIRAEDVAALSEPPPPAAPPPKKRRA